MGNSIGTSSETISVAAFLKDEPKNSDDVSRRSSQSEDGSRVQ